MLIVADYSLDDFSRIFCGFELVDLLGLKLLGCLQCIYLFVVGVQNLFLLLFFVQLLLLVKLLLCFGELVIADLNVLMILEIGQLVEFDVDFPPLEISMLTCEGTCFRRA